MKIFEYKAGSFIDQVTKTVGTATNVTHRKTEKGIAGVFDGPTGINFAHNDNLALTNKASWVFAFRRRLHSNVGGIFAKYKTDGDNRGYTITNALGTENDTTISFSNSNNGITFDRVHSDVGFFENNKIIHGMITFDNGEIKIYKNNVLFSTLTSTQTSIYNNTGAELQIGRYGGFRFNGEIFTAKQYNHVLTEQERNELYQEFLKMGSNVKPIKDFSYPKPTSLKEDGLVAAYNMVPQGNTLADISGNGNNAVVEKNGAISTKNGIKFNIQGVYSMPTILSSKGTIATRFKLTENDINNGCNLWGVFASSSRLYTNIQTNGNIRFGFGGNLINSLEPAKANIEYDLVVTYDDLTQNFVAYLNGEEIGSGTYTDTVNIINPMYIGALNISGSPSSIMDGEIYDIRFYNRVFTLQESKAYHNSFQTPKLVEDFSNNAVGSFPREWQKGIGSYEVREDVEKKYIECTAHGTIVIPSKTAYGEWEFDLYKATNGSTIDLYLVSDVNNPVAGSFGSGYNFRFSLDNEISFIRRTAGTGNTLFLTTPSYISINTWYGVKITRTTDGEFTVYIKGGDFGDVYQLVSVTGGTGSNPVTDNTFKTSNYFAFTSRREDRITNIKVK